MRNNILLILIVILLLSGCITNQPIEENKDLPEYLIDINLNELTPTIRCQGTNLEYKIIFDDKNKEYLNRKSDGAIYNIFYPKIKEVKICYNDSCIYSNNDCSEGLLFANITDDMSCRIHFNQEIHFILYDSNLMKRTKFVLHLLGNPRIQNYSIQHPSLSDFYYYDRICMDESGKEIKNIIDFLDEEKMKEAIIESTIYYAKRWGN